MLIFSWPVIVFGLIVPPADQILLMAGQANAGKFIFYPSVSGLDLLPQRLI
jgi:hypothetical protein